MRVLLVALALPLAVSVGDGEDQDAEQQRNVTIIIVAICLTITTIVFLAIAVVLCVKACSQRSKQAVVRPESHSGDTKPQPGGADLKNTQPLGDSRQPPPPGRKRISVRKTRNNEPKNDVPPTSGSPTSTTGDTPGSSEAAQREEIQRYLERMHQQAVRPKGASGPTSSVSSTPSAFGVELRNRYESPSSSNQRHPSSGASGSGASSSSGASGSEKSPNSTNTSSWSIDFDNVRIPAENSTAVVK